MVTAIIVAGGKSERMGGKVDKNFLSLVNKPVVAWSLLAFERCPAVDWIVLVVRKEQLAASQAVARMFGISKLRRIVAGGKTRGESVQAGLRVCDVDTTCVVVHDAARPMVSSEVIAEVVKASKRSVAATVGRPVTDTLKQCAKGTMVSATVPRTKIWRVQTPQAFAIKDLKDAYAALGDAEVTDDCEAVERNGVAVKIVESFRPNPKITVPEDLQLVSALLK